MALTTKQLTQLLRRHGALPAAVAGAGVVAVLLAQQLAGHLISVLAVAQFGGGVTAPAIGQYLLHSLPVGVGFFVSLWILAPIAEQLGLAHVVTRAVLATGVGATVLFIVLAVLAIVGGLAFRGELLAASFPAAAYDTGSVLAGLSSALSGALLAFVGTLPLGVLAGVLLWHWRKDHPPRHPLSGLIDEV